MGAPCIEDGNCTHFSMDGTSLRVDLKVDPNANNAAVCQPGGLYVQGRRARHLVGAGGGLTPGVDGLYAGYGAIGVDLIPWVNDADIHGGNVPQPMTDVTMLTYTNTTNAVEICNFGVKMGQTTFRQLAGWDLGAGVAVTWGGPAALVPISSFNSGIGFCTGQNAFAPAYGFTPNPAGVTMNGPLIEAWTEIAPGETLRIDWRTWTSYGALGQPELGSSVRQGISILFGTNAFITTWTK